MIVPLKQKKTQRNGVCILSNCYKNTKSKYTNTVLILDDDSL